MKANDWAILWLCIFTKLEARRTAFNIEQKVKFCAWAMTFGNITEAILHIQVVKAIFWIGHPAPLINWCVTSFYGVTYKTYLYPLFITIFFWESCDYWMDFSLNKFKIYVLRLCPSLWSNFLSSLAWCVNKKISLILKICIDLIL